MREFLKAVRDALKSGTPVELISLTESSGSTPRGAGTMMAVFSDGSSRGTIGGGNVEYEAQKQAVRLLKTGENAAHAYRFVQGDAASLGMVCGGDVTVHFQYLSPEDPHNLPVFEELWQAAGRNADTWLLRRLEGDAVTVMDAADRSGLRFTDALPPDALRPLLKNQAVITEEGWFAVPIVKAGRVYVFGGGHVSQELVPVLAHVGFRPVVYDDRPEFADSRLFPAAEEVLLGDFNHIEEKITITSDDYVVIMTRGHQADYEVLTQTLRSHAKYIGCIGSRRKLAFCLDRLLAAGFTEEEWARVHAPIGLAIEAETPEEIAVSVAGEMILVRATAE